MKSVIFATLTLLGASAYANCGGSGAACVKKDSVRKVSFAMPEAPAPVVKNGETATFQVKGMHCGSCAGKITKAIEALDLKAKNIVIDVENSRASFECGAQTCDLAKVFKSINSMGYKAGT